MPEKRLPDHPVLKESPSIPCYVICYYLMVTKDIKRFLKTGLCLLLHTLHKKVNDYQGVLIFS